MLTLSALEPSVIDLFRYPAWKQTDRVIAFLGIDFRSSTLVKTSRLPIKSGRWHSP